MKNDSVLHGNDLSPALIKFSGACALLLALAGSQAANAAVLKIDYAGGSFVTGGGNTSLGISNSASTFTVGGTLYTLSANPFQPTYLADPSANFMSIVQSQTSSLIAGGNNLTFGQLYNFNFTGKTLTNDDLVIRSYATHVGPGTNANDLLGEDFYVRNAGGTISGGSVHWIQVLTDNWKLSLAHTPPGTPDNKIDNGGPGAQPNPYYDTAGDGSSSYLYDDPSRYMNDVNGTRVYFNFETFLVKETSNYTLNFDNTVNTKGTIDVYDGVLWGFTIVPEPGCGALLVLALGCRWLMRRKTGIA